MLCAMYFFILQFFHVQFDILIPLVNNKIGIKVTQKNILVIMTVFLENRSGWAELFKTFISDTGGSLVKILNCPLNSG